MSDHAKLDDLYLDAPASHLLNDTEAALFGRMQTDWEAEVMDRVDTLVDKYVRRGKPLDNETLLCEAVQDMIGQLCAEDTQVEVGDGSSVSLTLDLIEVDVRPELLANALLADGFRVPARN